CKADLKVSGGDGVCGPAKAAALGAPCEFDVQCTSGRCGAGVCCDTDCAAARCGAGGQCVSVTGGGLGGGGGCGCRAGGSPAPGWRAWLGVVLAMLSLRQKRRKGKGTRA